MFQLAIGNALFPRAAHMGMYGAFRRSSDRQRELDEPERFALEPARFGASFSQCRIGLPDCRACTSEVARPGWQFLGALDHDFLLNRQHGNKQAQDALGGPTSMGPKASAKAPNASAHSAAATVRTAM